jgi:hypothetical protein
MQYWNLKVMVFDAKRTATSCNRSQGIAGTFGSCSNFVWNIGNCSLWSGILMPTLAICVIFPDSMGLPSMTSIFHFWVNSWRGIWWWRANSWSINAIPVALQSINACVGISWLFTVNVQDITKCFLSIDPSDTSTLLTDPREIPKHFKACKTTLFPSTKAPFCVGWHNLFPIPWSHPGFLLP